MSVSANSQDSKGSPERFGYEWGTYSELLPFYEEQFNRWVAHLSPDEWRGKTFLDVGCGMGRNSYWPMKYGAQRGVSIDIDERSLASAKQTLSSFPNCSVEKSSAYEIQYENEFDVVFSIGVIHHLAFPERALKKMVFAAKPGGKVIIWVYGRENNRFIVALLDPLRKALFSRLPISFVHHLSLYPSLLLWLALKLGFGRISYYDLIRKFSFPHLRSIVFDQMLPKIAHYWDRETVATLMEQAGLVNVKLEWVNQMSWSAIGEKKTLGSGSVASRHT